MTQEEKAKAYDKVREKIAVRFGTNAAEEIFSEFEESEDERIRKDCIKYLNWEYQHCPLDEDKMKIEKCIVWLEKQKEHTDKIVERAKTEKQRVLITESDGEANIDWDTRGLQDVKLLLEYGLNYVNKLEKQDGKKSADKIKPKFKVGDRIIFNGLVLLIKEVVQGYYRTISVNGIPHSYDWDIDNIARLWTAQDAKVMTGMKK